MPTKVVLVDSNEGCNIPQPLFSQIMVALPVRSANAVRYIDLRFATYKKKVLGKLSVIITTDLNEPKKFIIDISSIADNSFVRFDLDAHVYCTTISVGLEAEYRSADHIAVWYGGSIPSFRMFKDLSYVPSFEVKPLISIVTGVYNVDAKHFAKTISSVLAQSYTNWEWVIVDDCSTDMDLRTITNNIRNMDNRIKVTTHPVNKGISEAQNTALAEVTGDWFFVLDHDDTISPDTLLGLVSRISTDPTLDIIYTDEDKIDDSDKVSSPFYKPDWSPALLLCQNYVCHLCAYKVSSARSRVPGGFEKEYDGSQDYRYLLRFIKDEPVSVAHIPICLYHWRVHSNSTAAGMSVKPYAAIAARKTITEHLEGKAKVLSTEYSGVYRPYFKLYKYPPVSIIIPTKDSPGLIHNLLESLSKTNYDDLDIILEDNGSDMNVVGPVYEKYQNLFFTEHGMRSNNLTVDDGRYDFNFSYQINRGVRLAQSKYVLFLNNDIEIINPDWLKEMVALMELYPDVGAVGARLLYPDGTLQHGGVTLGTGGVAGHCHKHLRHGEAGYFSRVMTIHEVSAVTGACLLTRKSIHTEVGGLDEGMPRAFNDVDFCLKIRKAGYRILYQPWAHMFHHESVSRGIDKGDDPVFLSAVATMKSRWAAEIANDPYFNPHFSRASEMYVVSY